MNPAPQLQHVTESRAGPRPRLKVCHVAGTSEGATWMFEQLRELRDQYDLDVCAVVSDDRGALIDKLCSENIRYHVAEFPAGPAALRELLRMPLTVIKLARFFRRERFDVVQSHIFITMRTVRPAAWLADVPVRIAMIAGPYHLQAHTSRWIELATFWMDTILIPSCENSFDLCRKIKIPERYVAPVIYYGPDEQKFDPAKIPAADVRAEYGWPADTPLVCMVAYFYPRLPAGRWVPPDLRRRGAKGHEELIKAATIVLREFPNVKFLLVGSGWGEHGDKYLQEMKDLVRNLGLESSVVFPGFRSDANGILRAANVAVQASLNENLGGTIEALLMRCPTVATRVGGMVDSVRDGKTGVLVNPSDPDDLARGIIELLRHPEKARKLGRAGRELMLERFTLRHTVANLAALYEDLLVRANQKRRYYNGFISAARLFGSFPIFAYLSSRLFFVDMLPIHVARIRAVPARLLDMLCRSYSLVRRRNRGSLATESFRRSDRGNT